MGTTLTVLLLVAAFFCFVMGTAAMTFRMPPWLVGRVARPRMWGAGYTLLGVTALYHAVAELSSPHPALGTLMTGVTTVIALVGLALMGAARRTPRRSRSAHTESGATE